MNKTSFIAAHKAVAQSNLGPWEKLVFGVLTLHYHFERQEPYFVSRKQIAKEASCSEPQVGKAIRELKAKGFVRVDQQKAGFGVCKYHISIPNEFERWERDDCSKPTVADESRFLDDGMSDLLERGSDPLERESDLIERESDPLERQVGVTGLQGAGDIQSSAIASSSLPAQETGGEMHIGNQYAGLPEPADFCKAHCADHGIADPAEFWQHFSDYIEQGGVRFSGLSWYKPAARRAFLSWARHNTPHQKAA